MKIFVEIEGDVEIRAFFKWREEFTSMQKRKKEKEEFNAKHGATSIYELNLETKIEAIMLAGGIDTIERALLLSENEWLKIPNCGRVAYLKIKEALEDYKNKMQKC